MTEDFESYESIKARTLSLMKERTLSPMKVRTLSHIKDKCEDFESHER